MTESKTIKIQEKSDALEITIDWFSPVAYFLVFFSTLWFAALTVWYASVGGASLAFKLFSLIHVAAGLGIGYYTLCLFFNTTYMDVYDNYLTVYHKPIPWWKGNHEIPTQDISQIYVKQKITKGKNGTQVSYELRAKMHDNKEMELLALPGITDAQAKELEQRLEAYMGIEDVPVYGEHLGNRKKRRQVDETLSIVKPRLQRRDFVNFTLASIYYSKKGAVYQYKLTEHKVISVSQYDWVDGNTDKQFQVLDQDNKDYLLYMVQNKALLETYREAVLPWIETSDIQFQKEAPPKSIELDGVSYFLESYKKGNKFISQNSLKPIAIEQWIYLSQTKEEHLRIIDHQGSLSFYEGKQLDISDFEERLELNDLPEKQLDKQDSSWNEGDLV